MITWLMNILNLSLAAATVAVAVLTARLLLSRAPKIYSYLLWGAVFFRAVCPVSFSSPFSLFRIFSFWGTKGGQLEVTMEEYQAARMVWILGLGETPKEISEALGTAGTVGTGGGSEILGGMIGKTAGLAPGGVSIWQILLGIWLAGVVILLAYGVVSWLRLKRRAAFAVKTEDGVYESERISTAFVLGFFRPRIYLPTGLAERECRLVLAHERVHLRRHDQQFKMLAWLITILHWFNPLLWLSFVLMVRDMEMSCDERVLQNLGEREKKEYSSFLLAMAAPAGFPAGSPLAFGESSVKARIKNVLRYRRRSVIVGAVAFLLVAVTLVACLSNPSGQERITMLGNNGENSENLVIGGADGPTSIFLAGKLGGDTSREELEEVLGGKNQALLFVSDWAEAVANRDAETVYEMLAPQLQAEAESLGLETAENGVRVMGWSSPFVTSEVPPIVLLSEGDTVQAEVVYPAMTSDPSWWVWKDYLTLEKVEDTYQVTSWVQKDYFEITSLEEYLEAYSSWTPNYQHENGMEKSFAEYLQGHYEAGTNPDYYEQYLSPARAAEATLHLSGGTATVASEEEGAATVLYEWEDGTVQIDMIQPAKTGTDGIWVPEGWSAAMEE